MQLYWAYWNLHNCPRSSQEDSLNTRLNTTSKRVTVGHVEAYPLLAAVFGITGTIVTINISANYKHLMYGKYLWQHACDQKIRRCDQKIRRFDPKGSSLWQKGSLSFKMCYLLLLQLIFNFMRVTSIPFLVILECSHKILFCNIGTHILQGKGPTLNNIIFAFPPAQPVVFVLQ